MSHKLCIELAIIGYVPAASLNRPASEPDGYLLEMEEGGKKKSDLKVSACARVTMSDEGRRRKSKNKRETGRCQDAGAKGFVQLASDNSAFARMNSLRDYMAHADWTRDGPPFLTGWKCWWTRVPNSNGTTGIH